MQLVNAFQMRQADKRAMEEYGMPGLLLMENAAQAAAGLARKLLKRPAGTSLTGIKIVAMCGVGNNGGDAVACARILANQGAECTLALAGQEARLEGDAARNWQIAKNCGLKQLKLLVDFTDFNDLLPEMENCRLILDGLLGTGFTPPPRPHLSQAIEFINRFSKKILILALDIPSGQSADTGAGTVMVQADACVSFACLKQGIALNPFPSGEIHVADIGLPPGALNNISSATQLMEASMAAAFAPPRPPLTHKGALGHVFILGGCLGKSGAVALAAMGAQSSGAGLITAAVPHSLLPILETKTTAVMGLGLPQNLQQGLALAAEKILPGLAANAWVVGPGLGEENESRQLARDFLKQNHLPVVIDADAINALAPLKPGQIASPAALLTPHPGEAARLLNCTTAQIQANRLEAALSIAKLSGSVCLLKGAASVLAHPDGRALINHTGNHLLASGGSGDVLAGLAGGLLAQQTNAWQAGALAAYLHGLAADLALRDNIKRGWPIELLPSYITRAWNELLAT
jgi:NAD(P)H-hydrate epimerase